MLTGTLTALGGLGLFLLGMSVMTDGLKSAAHDQLRKLLARSSRSPTTGAITGAITTAIVQSSSATTVAAVGFVGAGLLTFPEALGIILGANVGTTMTGWLVALVGFKLKLGTLVLPLILGGMLLRLFGKGRLPAVGMAIAGFGLIFVGIDLLRVGMAGFSDVITPDVFPPDTLFGRLLLVLLGALVTVITQSSTAGVAMAMTALYAGNITLAQSLAMVIGMNVGTTVTAMVATIGGTVQSRRTGLAHVLYNLLTASLAFCLISPYLWSLGRFVPVWQQQDPELALVLFHTLFNIVGVAVVLPFARQFADLIIRLVPERGNPWTQRLDQQLMQTPELAIAAVEATVIDLVEHILGQLAERLGHGASSSRYDPELLDEALSQSHSYLQQCFTTTTNPTALRRLAALVHLLDHLRRLMNRMHERDRLAATLAIEELHESVDRLAATASAVAAQPHDIDAQAAENYHESYRQLKSMEKPFREENIARAVRGDFDTEQVIARTDAIRTLRRIGYHVWRIIKHLHDTQPPRPRA